MVQNSIINSINELVIGEAYRVWSPKNCPYNRISPEGKKRLGIPEGVEYIGVLTQKPSYNEATKSFTNHCLAFKVELLPYNKGYRHYESVLDFHCRNLIIYKL